MEPITYEEVKQYHQIGEIVKKNLYLLKEGNTDDIDFRSLVAFNNRLVISESKSFLEALKRELGGEIIEDSKIGTFLYYGEIE